MLHITAEGFLQKALTEKVQTRRQLDLLEDPSFIGTECSKD